MQCDNLPLQPKVKGSLLSKVKTDLSAGLVVFLIALPLCLGISLNSCAPPLFSGIIEEFMATDDYKNIKMETIGLDKYHAQRQLVQV